MLVANLLSLSLFKIPSLQNQIPSLCNLLSNSLPFPQPSTSFSSSLSCTQSDPEISPVSQIIQPKRTSAQSTPSMTEKSLKKKRTATANKSTQTETFDADVVERCNVCLGDEEKGQWVGCSHRGKKCDYWVMTVAWDLTLKRRRWSSKFLFCVPNREIN